MRCSDAEALFTFTASRAELRFPAMEARPRGGGRVRCAAAISVDPAAESDPHAVQVTPLQPHHNPCRLLISSFKKQLIISSSY